MNKTFLSSSNHNEKKWYLVDMSNRILGRTITEIATILIGKHKINYHPFTLIIKLTKITLYFVPKLSIVYLVI